MKIMKNKLLIGVFVVLAVALTGCSYSNKPSSSGSSAVATNAVSANNFAFSPSNITVKVGTEVTFTNDDSTTHTITFDLFQSGDVAPGQSFKHTFDTAGTFSYHCSIHPSMTGQVEVTP